MSGTGRCPFTSRRGFIAGAGGLMAAGASLGVSAAAEAPASVTSPATEPFWGAHQAGILTPTQAHTCFAAFDIATKQQGDLIQLLKTWTEAAARMSAGEAPDGDSGEALGLSPARLTVTFGFGPTMFTKDGQDRFGLAARRPAALADLPRFNGDQLVPARTGGDLSVQACSDDPQVAFHAVRALSRLAYGAAELRWLQTGFSANARNGETSRNLMGFKDGTQSPLSGGDRAELADRHVWAGEEGPGWMRGGSYVVVRRIRVSLEHWDRTDVAFQEQVVGRGKVSGAPLGAAGEFDALPLDAVDKDGNSIIPDNAHVRLANSAANGAAQILRRGYSYNDGASFTAERWPPWRQGMEFDAGLLFVAYQRDPREGFIKLFEPMAKLDAMNQFTTHTGGGLFACPGGTRAGGFIGAGLFETA